MHGLETRRNNLPLAIMVIACSMLVPNAGDAQSGKAEILPPANPATFVRITKGPALELVRDNLAIIRWTSNNPGGTDEHFGIVRYGTDPHQLGLTAKSHIRLNQGHSYTVFRVRVDGLRPQTTYYYTVDSQQASGKSDGVKSPVAHFKTP
jgi:hypothetical protein